MREEIRKDLARLDSIIGADFARKSALGEHLNFAAEVTRIERAVNLLGALKSCNLEIVPQQPLTNMRNPVREMLGAIENIRSWNGQDGVSGRTNLIDALERSYNNAFPHVAPVVALDRLSKLESDVSPRLEAAIKASENKLDAEAAAVRNRLSDVEQGATNKLAEIDRVVQQVKTSAAGYGVSQQATIFADEAKTHRKRAFQWLASSAVLAAITLLAAWWLFKPLLDLSPAVEMPAVIGGAVGRLALLSIPVWATMWSARNYRATQHNYLVNRHRASALMTFEVFAQAATEKATKSAVLLQATQAIFAPQDTGFAGEKGDSTTNSRLMEIIRNESAD